MESSIFTNEWWRSNWAINSIIYSMPIFTIEITAVAKKVREKVGDFVVQYPLHGSLEVKIAETA